tara:strand:+ start:3476 stop:6382 length:2907 start_codon:yes stop_codon:yes gene_type:complete
MSSRDKDVDRFKGTEWEDAVDVIRKEAFERFESDAHSSFESLLRMDSHSMLTAITSHVKSLARINPGMGEKMQVRLDLLRKLQPLQEKFEKAREEADAKNKLPLDPYHFDPSPGVGTLEEQLEIRHVRHKKAHAEKNTDKATASGTRSIPYLGAGLLSNVSNSGPGGVFGKHKQKSAGQSRGREQMQAAQGGRTVVDQCAALRKKGDLNQVRISPEAYRLPPASRPTRREQGGDPEYFPLATQKAAREFIPPMKTSARNAARKTECIELLSDEEEADGAGPAGAIILGDDEVPKTGLRATRSSIKLSIPDRIGNIKVIYPTRPGGTSNGTVEVTSRDLLTLEDYEFLNDSVIEFFIKDLQYKMKPEVAERCYIFNSFFYEKLTNVRDEQSEPADVRQKKAHERVAKWTKGVNIFEKDFVFFPIHNNVHWSLVVLCHPGRVQQADVIDVDGASASLNQVPSPFLLHFDSMSGGHKTTFVSARLREYLAMEWLQLNPNTKPKQAKEGEVTLLKFTKDGLPSKRMKVPQQDNGCDCGVFLCMFFKYFFLPKLPDRITAVDVEAAHRQDTSAFPSDLPEGFLRRDWFPPEEATSTRSTLMFDILEQLKTGVMLPETAREQGAGAKTIKNLETHLASIDAVMKEVQARVEVRTEFVWDAIAERKRKKKAEQERKRQREEETEQKAAPVPFSGHSNTLRRATAIDGGEALDSSSFYGKGPNEAWGATISTAGRGSDEGEVDLTMRDSDSGRGGGQRSGAAGKLLSGLSGIPSRKVGNVHEPPWARGVATAKPPVNTEEGAESDDDGDDGFKIKTYPTQRRRSPDPASPVRRVQPQVIDVSADDPLETEQLQSESESEEPVQSTASPPPRTRDTRATKQTTLGFKTAAISAADEALEEVARKKKRSEEKDRKSREWSEIHVQATRKVATATGSRNPDVDLTVRSGGSRDGGDEGGLGDEAGLGRDDEMDHDALAR